MRWMRKILIIEDEEDIAELEKDYLEIDGFETDILCFRALTDLRCAGQ